MTPSSSARPPIRVVVVDDDGLLRDSLSYLLDADPDITVVGTADDGDRALRTVDELRPDVVLMDVRMPRLDGIEATRLVKSRLDPPRVLVLSVFGHDDYVFRALRAGADGFLPKRVRGEDLCRAIKIVASGDALVDPSLTRALVQRFVGGRVDAVDLADDFGLSDREIDVLAELAAGKTNDEIAGGLAITEHTVKSHLASIFAKVGCTNRVQAVIFAFDAGLAVPHPLRSE